MKNISILCPTRQRAERAVNYAESVFETANEPERVELLFYIDSDDPEKARYLDLFIGFPLKYKVKIIVDEPKSISKSWNDLAKACIGDILLMGNDDLVHETHGWDTVLENTSNEFPDDIYCIFFNDGINAGKHCAFPAVSRKWYETLGYFTPGIFEFIANDSWVFDIGKRVNRIRYVPEVMVRHNHHSVTKFKDETTKRHRDYNPGRIKRDLSLMKKTGDQREVDANKLRSVMF